MEPSLRTDPHSVTDASTPWSVHAHRSARIDFEASPSSPRRTRNFVSSMARGWGFGDLGSLAELLVSEVVTNAIEHGGSGGTVEVMALPAGLRVEVTDRAGGRPEVRHPSELDPSGRGLAIVDRLSRWWGVDIVPGGKVIWFEVDDLDLPDEA